MANDQVSVEISIEERQALRALAALTRGIDKFEKNTTKSVKKTDMAWASFTGNISAIAASKVFSVITDNLSGLVIGSIEASAATEKIRTQLEVLTGSQEKAADLYRQLTEYSAGTPFQLQGIAEATAQLISFGFEVNTVQQRIEKIGEVAAGSGADLKDIALIYGQVAAAGKLTGERLLQLQERAIPIGSALAKSLGVAESQVKSLVSQGVVGFADFERAFNSLSESGGLFEGAVQKQSETLNGVLSTLGDNFFILQSKIGEAFAPSVIDGVKSLTTGLQDLNKSLEDDSKGFGLFASIVAETTGNVLGFAGEMVRTKTPMEKINKELADLIDQQQELAKESQEAKQSLGDYFGLFDANQQMFIDKTAKKLTVVQEKIDKLEAARQRLIKAERSESKNAAVSDEATDGRADQDAKVNQKILDQRRALELQLALINEEKKIKTQEASIANLALEDEQRANAINRLTEFENNKASIEYNATVEKNKKLEDAESRRLANIAAATKLAIRYQQNKLNAEKKIAQEEEKVREQQVAGFGRATALAASIAKKGTAEQKALSVASAVINTYAAGTRAFKDYPYPANIAVLATTIAAGLKQVSAIQSQSFATGGVVGGFSGATMGQDNTTANVRRGEMVLNANQQRRLFDIANRQDAPVENKTIELTTVVQIDEREIARSVRNQTLEGYAI